MTSRMLTFPPWYKSPTSGTWVGLHQIFTVIFHKIPKPITKALHHAPDLTKLLRITTNIAKAFVVAYLKIQRATTTAVVVVSKSPRTTTTALRPKRSQTHTLLTHITKQNSKN